MTKRRSSASAAVSLALEEEASRDKGGLDRSEDASHTLL